jgi:hypothetical protein
MRESSCQRRHRPSWTVSSGRAYCPHCREDRGWVEGAESGPPQAPASAAPAPAPSVSAPEPAPAPVVVEPAVDVSFADAIRGEGVPDLPRRPGRVRSAETDASEVPSRGVRPAKSAPKPSA